MFEPSSDPNVMDVTSVADLLAASTSTTIALLLITGTKSKAVVCSPIHCNKCLLPDRYQLQNKPKSQHG
jgi:hypothetical protein